VQVSEDQGGAQPEGAPDPGFDEVDQAAQEQAGITPSGEPVRLRMRRAPKYTAFGLTGTLVGVVIGVILAVTQPANGDYSQRTIAGYLAVGAGLIGALIGLAAALLVERRRRT
jgi:hypothetical protein